MGSLSLLMLYSLSHLSCTPLFLLTVCSMHTYAGLHVSGCTRMCKTQGGYCMSSFITLHYWGRYLKPGPAYLARQLAGSGNAITGREVTGGHRALPGCWDLSSSLCACKTSTLSVSKLRRKCLPTGPPPR